MFNYFEDDEPIEMDPIEAEVDAIRKKIWERVKDMTPEEQEADLKRRSDPIIKQYHMKVSKLEPFKLRDPAEYYAARAKRYEDYNSL